MRKNLLRVYVLLLAGALAGLARESLVIGPGDQLHIVVFDTPEMEQTPRVMDNGMAPLLFAGNLRVAGLTPDAAARAIEAALKEKGYMLNPHVTVTVDEYSAKRVSILGQVTRPGAYPITSPQPILTVLSLAGGLTELADRHITIERQGDEHFKINYFLSNKSEEALAAPPVVNPGDTILVPKAGVVYVLGDVGKPGGYAMSTDNSGMSVLQVLSLAGAPNKTAVLSKSQLIRRNPGGAVQQLPLELAGMEKGKRPDIQMQPDDVIFVPFSYMKNIVVNGTQILASASSAAIYHP